MDQNLDNKIELKSKLINFYKENKIKILIFFSIFLIIVALVIFLQINNERKNILISEQYIKAGILYSKNQNQKSKEIYENILKSKNSFYSTLALNNIVEKDLENDKNKILEYFDKVEKLQKNKDQKDILKFKKALFLLKNFEKKDANKLFKELINTNSKIKNLAEEILSN